MINRWALAMGLGLFAAALAAEAQPTAKTYRLGRLYWGSPPLTQMDIVSQSAFLHRLRALGYREGENLTIERRFGDGRPDRLREAARELAQSKVDVIFTAGDEAIRAAKEATETIPIIMMACDAVESGLIQSLARPGGNVSGITCLSGDLGAKRVEILRGLIGNYSRLAVIYNPRDPHTRNELTGVQMAVKRWAVETQFFGVADPAELEAAFSEIADNRIDSLFVVGDSFTVVHRSTITQLAAKHRLPAVYAFKEFVEAGGLAAYGPNLIEVLHVAAGQVDRVLRGAKPADLPVQQPTKFELTINLKTAKALGLTIPPSVLLRADRVIDP